MKTPSAKPSNEAIYDTLWDVVVVGGGPAGMMAAARAAEGHARVLLIEKNSTLGKKLLITGGGRCNVTNAELDTRKFLEKFKGGGKYMFSTFSQWSVKETLDFFHLNKMDTKVEKEQRVFPVTDKAQSVWDVLVANIKKHGVTVLSDSPVVDLVAEEKSGGENGAGGKKITGVLLKGKKVIKAKTVILATGGTSRPETGSTGDGYAWLKKIGHKVIEPTPSLVPIAIKDDWVKRLAGLTLTDVKLSVFQNKVKQEVGNATGKGSTKANAKKGKLLFTHVGVSGPTILNMSKDVGELLKYGDVVISIDLLPQFDYSALNTRLQELFAEKANMKFKNALSGDAPLADGTLRPGLIPSTLAPIIVYLSGINPDIQCNSVTREARLKLVNLLKGVPMHVNYLLGLNKAIISSGGVSLDEVDSKTMQSRLYPNLYLVGDILNIDRPSGGYSLQLCWTTGFVAGTHAGMSAASVK